MLAKIDSWTSNKLAMDSAKYDRTLGNDVWIGANDIALEKSWVWPDGKTVTYKNWAHREPNNFGNEDCASMYRNTGKWNDARCSNQFPFICSYPSANVTSKLKAAACAKADTVCSMQWCTSPNGHGRYDCWAGTTTEKCTCSKGSARETGKTIRNRHDDKKVL